MQKYFDGSINGDNQPFDQRTEERLEAQQISPIPEESGSIPSWDMAR